LILKGNKLREDHKGPPNPEVAPEEESFFSTVQKKRIVNRRVSDLEKDLIDKNYEEVTSSVIEGELQKIRDENKPGLYVFNSAFYNSVFVQVILTACNIMYSVIFLHAYCL
jgi:hypothetical protein